MFHADNKAALDSLKDKYSFLNDHNKEKNLNVKVLALKAINSPEADNLLKQVEEWARSYQIEYKKIDENDQAKAIKAIISEDMQKICEEVGIDSNRIIEEAKNLNKRGISLNQ